MNEIERIETAIELTSELADEELFDAEGFAGFPDGCCCVVEHLAHLRRELAAARRTR